MNLKRLLMAFVLPLLWIASANAQGRVVTGKVTDSKDGSPLASITVTVKGTRVATQTGADGTFRLTVPAEATTLVISSVGYATREVAIASDAMNISLDQSSESLSEVVVIGYGTQRKRDVTGAVATVASKDFQKGAIQTPEQLIAGKVAGVQITSNGGAPGAGSRIRIRGGASLNASNDPLIVIDGVPVDGGVAGSANVLNMINPNDIETFTILKDPSAAAIYGSRASNGVVLITTKKGRKGKTQFSFNSQFFAQEPASRVDVLTADQIRSIVTSKGSTGDVSKLSTANTDWQDEIFKTAFGQDLNLAASGAMIDGNLPIRASVGYLNQDGILMTSNFQRQSLALNLSPKFLNDNLKIEINLKGTRTTNRFADEGAIGQAIHFDPTQPVRTNSSRFGGFFEYLEPHSAGGFIPRDLAPRNPVSLLEMRDNKSEVYRSIGNIQFDYQLPFLKGLRANLNLGYDVQDGSGTDVASDSAGNFYRRRYIGTKVNQPSVDSIHTGGMNNEYHSEVRNQLLDFYLNYATDVTSIKSRFDVMAGYGYQDFYFTEYGFPDRRLDKSVITGANSAYDPRYTMISYYGRLNYTLANRYVLTLNARTDGVSRFAEDYRWGFFPSAAFAWRINEESFLKNSRTVTDLKLRVGYGITGQQAGIPYYGYIPNYGFSNSTAQYQLGDSFYHMYRPDPYVKDLKWETTNNLNLGLDYGFFNNRLTGSIDVFYRKTKDLLSLVPLPLGTNFSNQLVTNVGNVESKGFEFTVNWVPIRKANFEWDLSYNISYSNPEITNLLFNPDPTFKGVPVGGISGGTGNRIQINSVGYNPNAFYVRKQVYDQNGRPIEGLYEDLNRDGLINDEDFYHYQAPEPTVFMGFSTNVNYRKWTAGFVMRGSFNNYVYNNVQSNLGVKRAIFNPLGWINNGSVNYLQTGFENNQYFSDYYVQNASFVRMDNINIGYQAGQVFKGASLRITANIQNVFVITKYEGIDPELNGGIDNQFYPRPRTYALGFNLNF